ncbi:LysE family translocator [Sphingomonas sp. IW22]|uniref:LysE family translocator n=1 Tax=Sphingomonas sp. IW22 TaxID=3242489 RepID=UPI00351FF4AE
MDLQLWLAFLSASLVIGIIPGPGVASIVGFAFSSGRRVALASVAGMALGNAIAISVSLAGAGAILSSSAVAFTILKWVGAAYLVVVGLIAVLGRDAPSEDGVAHRPISARTAFATNMAVGTFHPKTILFFVAFASQFIQADRPYLAQAAILVATFTGAAAATDTLYAVAASRASGLVRKPAARRWARRAGGGAVMAAGIAMAAMRR